MGRTAALVGSCGQQGRRDGESAGRTGRSQGKIARCARICPISYHRAPPPGGGKDFVTALHKRLEVLTRFGRETSRLTLSEVARLTGASPASARRSVHTLAALGYLDTNGKRFWMSPRALLVAHAYLASRPTPQLAQPVMYALSERTRESASLGKLLNDDVIVIARSTARRSLSIGLGIGSRLPAYCSALGRSLLASLAPDGAQRRLHAMRKILPTRHTVHREEEVQALVHRCHEQG